MQLPISAGILVLLSFSSVNAIAMRSAEFPPNFDYCGEILNPFTGTSACVCINQLNEALANFEYKGFESFFDGVVRDGPPCTPPAPTTPDLTTPPASANDGGEGGENQESGLESLNVMPTETSDEKYGDEYVGLDFSLGVLGEN